MIVHEGLLTRLSDKRPWILDEKIREPVDVLLLAHHTFRQWHLKRVSLVVSENLFELSVNSTSHTLLVVDPGGMVLAYNPNKGGRQSVRCALIATLQQLTEHRAAIEISTDRIRIADCPAQPDSLIA